MGGRPDHPVVMVPGFRIETTWKNHGDDWGSPDDVTSETTIYVWNIDEWWVVSHGEKMSVVMWGSPDYHDLGNGHILGIYHGFNHHIPWFLRPVLCHLPPDFHLHRQVGVLLERGHRGDVEGAKGKQLDTVNFIWLVVWNIFYFSIYWEFHHPKWLSYFSEG